MHFRQTTKNAYGENSSTRHTVTNFEDASYYLGAGGNYSNVSIFFDSMELLHCEIGKFQESLDSFKGSLLFNHKHGGKDGVNTKCWIGRIYREKNAYNSALDCFL